MEWVDVVRVQIKSLGYFFFFNDTATTEIYTLSLHDALPIFEDSDHILLKVHSAEGLNVVT